jgi:hypothetical protein
VTRRVWVVCVLAAASVVWLPTHLSAQAPWTKVRGEGFELRSQISSGALAGVSCDLETAIRIFRRSVAGRDAPRVVAVDNGREMREWLPQFNERGRGDPLGAYWRGLYGDHIVVRVDAPPAERLRRVLHEYAHYVTHLTHSEPAPWLDEGISEIWEHAAVSKKTIEVGRPVKEHLKSLRSQKDWIPVHELLATTEIPTRTNSASAIFYAESWALVHYFIFEQRSGRLVLDGLTDPADVPTDAELKAYIKGPMGAPVTIASAADPKGCLGQTAVSGVSMLDSLLDRAKALADGERPEAAIPQLQAALLLDPDNAETMETIGFVYFRENRPVEAASLFDRVIAGAKASHISYYYRVVLAGPVPKITGRDEPIPQVEYLRKALALNPGFAPAVQRLSELARKRGTLPSGLCCDTVNAERSLR